MVPKSTVSNKCEIWMQCQFFYSYRSLFSRTKFDFKDIKNIIRFLFIPRINMSFIVHLKITMITRKHWKALVHWIGDRGAAFYWACENWIGSIFFGKRKRESRINWTGVYAGGSIPVDENALTRHWQLSRSHLDRRHKSDVGASSFLFCNTPILRDGSKAFNLMKNNVDN